MNKSLSRIIKICLCALCCLLGMLLFRHALEDGSTLQKLILKARSNPETQVAVLKESANLRTRSTPSNPVSTTKGLNARYDASKDTTAAEMKSRGLQALKACQDMGYNSSADARLPRALVSVSRAVIYCPVEKTASTFFRRYLYQLDHTTPMRSPFEVPVKLIYGCPNIFTTLQSYASHLAAKKKNTENANKSLAKGKTKNKSMQKKAVSDTLDNFLHKSTTFLFVRDPYSRLFSAYIDKLVAPNPDHWDTWGRAAIRKYRKKPSKLSLKCGHDVTFQEFLSFVLDLNVKSEKSDPHLRPIFELCRPCSFNYTVIGHMNTFESDVAYLSSLVNVTHSQLELDKMAADSARDTIEESVVDAFTTWSARIAKCMSKMQAGKRIWTKLQHRGIVSGTLQFPFNSAPDIFEHMKANDFIRGIVTALEASKDLNELHRQRTKAISNAYETVNGDILNKIAKMYAADFKVFGFNDRPTEVFSRASRQPLT